MKVKHMHSRFGIYRDKCALMCYSSLCSIPDSLANTEKNTTDCEKCKKAPPCPPGPPGPPAPLIVVTKEVEVPVIVSESPEGQLQRNREANSSTGNGLHGEMSSSPAANTPVGSNEVQVGTQSGNNSESLSMRLAILQALQQAKVREV